LLNLSFVGLQFIFIVVYNNLSFVKVGFFPQNPSFADHLLANSLLEVAKKNAVKPEGQWLSPEPSDAQPSSSPLDKAWRPDGFTIFF